MWAVLIALALFVLISSLDDLFVALVQLFDRRPPFPWPLDKHLEAAPEHPIAVFLPLWREHRVIGQMLERNIPVLSYENFQFFVGVYPNDCFTLRAVADVARRYSNIHIAYVGHQGPTSKGDCLNWIYRAMEAYERQHGMRFQIVVTHDAEDLMHPLSLRLINWFAQSYDMVQLPVLPLATGAEWTHGIYCDEFAEFQSKDIPVRQRLGGFLPANGVGVGFRREALDRLAASRFGRVFDPASLTEDYESGYLLHRLGCRQIFVPLRFDLAGPIATREYFPRRWGQAVRQRSRWIGGIALQAWQRHGWRAPWKQVYWFWRDRKGLVGNLISPIASLVFMYGLAGGPLPDGGTWAEWVFGAALGMSSIHVALRMRFAARIYGWRFACRVPLRVPWSNLVNGAATALALYEFAAAQVGRRRLRWRKTEHAASSALRSCRGWPRIGDLLLSKRWISISDVEVAAKEKPAGVRLGEYLIHQQKLTEDKLYQALSLQTGIPVGLPSRNPVNPQVARLLPVSTLRRWRVLPFRVAVGQLHVLTCEIPSLEMTREICNLSRLELQFRLVAPAEMELLTWKHLPLLH